MIIIMFLLCVCFFPQKISTIIECTKVACPSVHLPSFGFMSETNCVLALKKSLFLEIAITLLMSACKRSRQKLNFPSFEFKY